MFEPRKSSSSNEYSVKLIQKEYEIKVFHLMVKWLKEIDIKSSDGTELQTEKSKADKIWAKISKNFGLFGFSYVKYSSDRCREIFYEWTKFYAQNYVYLNGNLDEKPQEIFDLMKIVHILDFSEFWSSYDWTHILLKDISEKFEIIEYLNKWKKANGLESTSTKTNPSVFERCSAYWDNRRKDNGLGRISAKTETKTNSESSSEFLNDLRKEYKLETTSAKPKPPVFESSSASLRLEYGPKSTSVKTKSSLFETSLRPLRPEYGSKSTSVKTKSSLFETSSASLRPEYGSKSTSVKTKSSLFETSLPPLRPEYGSESTSAKTKIKTYSENSSAFLINLRKQYGLECTSPKAKPKVFESSFAYLRPEYGSESSSAKTKTTAKFESNSVHLNEMSAKLVTEFEDIEAFNLIVQLMESYVSKDLEKRTKGLINWEVISQNMSTFGYSYETYSAIKCREKFYDWSEFYAKNYDSLEGKLDPESQKVFDLFKLVNVLDFTTLWRPQDSTLILLNRISLILDPFLPLIKVKKQRKSTKTVVNERISDISPSRSHENRESEGKVSEEEWKEVKQRLKRTGKERQSIARKVFICEEVITNFDDMNLRRELLRGIYAYGLEKPSAIQQRAIVPCIKGKDIVAQAQSGTGKTAAFVISILQMIDTSLDECQALILAPTRELAQQIQRTVLSLGKYMGVECHVCIGGTPVQEDILLLQMDMQIVVGTVGRVCDLIKRRALRLEHMKLLVLDESDQLLDLSEWLSEKKNYRGFTQKVFEIIELLNPTVQLFFSSATMPPDITKVSKWIMRNPIRILVKNEELTLRGIRQFYVQMVSEKYKLDSFCDLYKSLSKCQTFVYCNTRERVDKLFEQLLLRNIIVANIHGSMDQSKREEVLRGFRFGVYRMLLTSDLLGRGIDVQQVSVVINYDFPRDRETYIHRVGRSGRFGRKGIAITFVTNREKESIKELQKFYSTQIDELPTDLSQMF